MPTCGTCGKVWPEGHRACPEDGTRLDAGLGYQPTGTIDSVGYQPTGAMAPLGYQPTGAMSPLPPERAPARAASSAPAHAAVQRAMSRQGLSSSNPAPETDSDAEHLAPNTTVGEYRIERKLGEGGMGAVYAARHPLIGKRAAIKVITRALCASTQAVERFILEARAVNQISHPNIVDVFSFGTLPDGRCYLVMELLQGEPLGARMAREPLAIGEALEFLDAIAKALDAAHEAGIIHRDLKPDNVYLEAVKGERPQVKLLDFGLAKLSGGGDMRAERTRSGIAMGTPLYISPEQARGRSVDHRTDIYALGVMAYEMILRRPPFLAEAAVQIMAMHISDPPPPPRSIWPAIPPAIEGLILAMLEKDPARRPTLGEVRARLAEARGIAQGVNVAGSFQAMSPPHTPYATPSPMVGYATPHPGPGYVTPPSAPGYGYVTPAVPPGLPSAAPSQPPLAMAETAMMGVTPGVGLDVPRPKRRRGALIAAGIIVGTAAALILVLATRSSDRKPVAATAADTAPTPAARAQSTPANTTATPTPTDTTPTPTPTDTTPTPTPVAESRPPTPAAPTTGHLSLTLNVPNARVDIDGKTITPSADSASVDLPAGDHDLSITAPRRKPYEKRISITAGERLAMKVRLDRAAAGSKSSPDPGPGDSVDLDTPPPTTTTTTTTTTQPKNTGTKPKDIDAVADPFAKPKK